MPSLTFDDLIPHKQTNAPPPSSGGGAGMFDDLIPTPNVGGRSPDATQMDYARDSMSAVAAPSAPKAANLRPVPGMGQMLLEAEHNNQLAARQRTDPSVYDGARPLRRKLGVLLPEYSDMGEVDPGTFITEDKRMARVDPSAHVVLIDPATGQPTVFERNSEAVGTDVTEEPAWKSLGRMILPGFVSGPVAGPSRLASSGRGAEIAAGTLAAQRAQNAAEDLMSFERAQVPVFAPAFGSTPTRAMAKGLSETFGVGAPLQGALENTYRGMSTAATRVADEMSPVTTADQAGIALQRGLDRFRTAGVRDIEPGVLAERGIDPIAPVQPRQIMSQGAEQRAAAAAPIRAANDGGTAETARGVQVPSARPLDQTILSRRAIEDLTDDQVAALTRAPAGETSFAARAEALYEMADRQLPRQMRINETANPQELRAVNTRNAVNAMRAEQERTRIPGGVVNGRFSGLADRVQTNVTLPTLRAMRTAIGRELANFSYAETGLDRTQLKSIYGSVSRDIEIAYQDLANRAHLATRTGNNRPDRVSVEAARAADRALYQFRRADRYFRQGMQRMDTFLSVVNAQNPELAARRLVTAATSGGRGDIAMFRNAMSALRPEERADFASLVIRQMGTPAASARGIAQEVGFSPSTFATSYQKLDRRARDLLFPGEHGRAIDDLFRIANRLANVERFENVSGSGRMTVNVGGVFAGLGSLLTGTWPYATGVAASGFGLSYLMSRPSYAKWAVSFLELKAAAAQSGRAMSRRSDLFAHINKLGQWAQRDPELLEIYRSLAAEDGVIERGNEEQHDEQGNRIEDPKRRPQSEFRPWLHNTAPPEPSGPSVTSFNAMRPSYPTNTMLRGQ